LNFLAHALFAGDDPALMVGGVIGDWIKGPLPGLLPADLAKGVVLHRAIDSFAESNPAFNQSRSRISGARRRYAGVLVDIFYDHLLARHWHDVHDQPLHVFCNTVYAMINDRLPELPEASHPALQMMDRENLLLSYAHIDGIADVLQRMSRRARQPNPLAQGEQEMLADMHGFTGDFHLWLKNTREFSQAWRAMQVQHGGKQPARR
jgi:acyl carrier protein phosphodiesterase